MSLVPTIPLSVFLALFVAGCADDARPPQTPPPPPMEAPPPPSHAAHAAPVAEPVAIPTVARPAGCEVHCIAASGAHPVDGALEDQIGAALGPTFDNLRSCTDLRTRHSPMMTLRFGSTGQLTFIGADTADFPGVESCIDNAVNGSAAGVTMAGRAVLRCAEHCPRVAR
jgi:hypothetical protein